MITGALSDSYSTLSLAPHSLLPRWQKLSNFQTSIYRQIDGHFESCQLFCFTPSNDMDRAQLIIVFLLSNRAQLSICRQWGRLTLGLWWFHIMPKTLMAMSKSVVAPRRTTRLRVLSQSRCRQSWVQKIKKKWNETLQTQVVWVAEIAWRSVHWKCASVLTACTTEPSTLDQKVGFTFKAPASWTFLAFSSTTSTWAT